MKIIESYNMDESFLYDKSYMFIKGYATALNLNYTLKALPLARKFHNGQYRKNEIEIDGKKYKLPYVLHVLKVCSTIISLHLPLETRDLDILLSSALLHDSLEDAQQYFQHGSTDLMTVYGFPREVFDVVTLVSKRSGATEPELDDYFNKIKKNRLALIVKLADRSHNVEDLYVMNIEKLHKYVEETRTYLYPLATYGKATYPEFSNGLTILKNKIRSLTEEADSIIVIYEKEIDSLKDIIKAKDKEIADLKKQLKDK